MTKKFKTIKEQTNDSSFTWCDILIKSLDFMETIKEVGIEIDTNSRCVNLTIQLYDKFSEASRGAIRHICKRFVEDNKCSFREVKISELSIIISFEKRERAKLLRKENPLACRLQKMY